MNSVLRYTLSITVCCASSAVFVRADDLRKHLAGIHLEKQGVSGDIERLEKQCLDLLDEYSSPEDQGRIYAHIAHVVYGQAGPKKDPNKQVEYCQKALQFPLDVVTAARIYGTWGAALSSASRRQVKWPESPWHRFPDVRREAATLFLRGMKLVLDQGAPAERQPLPPVGKFTCHPIDSPGCQELVKKNKEQVRAREKVEFENELAFHRKILTGQCVHVYSQDPINTEELAALAREILGDEEAVEDLVSRVEARIQERSDKAGTKKDE